MSDKSKKVIDIRTHQPAYYDGDDNEASHEPCNQLADKLMDVIEEYVHDYGDHPAAYLVPTLALAAVVGIVRNQGAVSAQEDYDQAHATGKVFKGTRTGAKYREDLRELFEIELKRMLDLADALNQGENC